MAPAHRGIATVSAVVLLVVALVAASVAGYALTVTLDKHPAEKSIVLIPKGMFYSIPAGQFNAVAFQASGSGVVKGSIWNTWGINVYLMTPQEVVYLSSKGVVESYSWASGRIANLTETNLSIVISPGGWDVVFLNTDNPTTNPIWTNTTVVGFYTDVALSPS